VLPEVNGPGGHRLVRAQRRGVAVFRSCHATTRPIRVSNLAACVLRNRYLRRSQLETWASRNGLWTGWRSSISPAK
jgi:hypothetical protein